MVYLQPGLDARCIGLQRPISRLTKIVMHGLNLRVRLQAIRAQLSANPALLEPPKRHAGMQQRVLVDPDSPGVNGGRGAHSLLGIAGENGRAEAVC
jgi:hypothetical protein